MTPGAPSPEPYRLRPRQTASMITRDGIRLDADIYRPDDPGPFPVLLMRQPYGRAIASTVTYAHPSSYARRGYIVVVQDVRGRGTSEGEFDLLVHEKDDGVDAIEWAAALPDSTGAVGMYGFSYQGSTQLLAAAARPPALRAICPAMPIWDAYADIAYEHGAFRLQSAMSWGIQLAAETARRRRDAAAHQALYAASRNLPLWEVVPARPAVLERLDSDSPYLAWLAHPRRDDYWAARSPCAFLDNCAVPALWISGRYELRSSTGRSAATVISPSEQPRPSASSSGRGPICRGAGAWVASTSERTPRAQSTTSNLPGSIAGSRGRGAAPMGTPRCASSR